MMLPPLYTPPAPHQLSMNTQATSQLAEFASSMVYLMWHARKAAAKLSERNSSFSPLGHNELAYLMWQARKPASSKSAYSPLNDHSLSYTASPAFKKFCFQVLTATQLHESAVYLSLKYIAILLQSNPSIEGAEGSEYRLFIVALMLANKFLDDNTFTNKTWSDVSGMKVYDLNIMEAEFLEALDYNLFVREHEFGIWKRLLEECRDRAHMSYYDSPRQQQHLVLMTLQTLGLYRIKEDSNYNHIPSSPSSPIWEEQQQYEWESASRLQYESSRYQQFIQSSKLPTHLPYVMQPPITPTIVPPQPTSSYGYCGYMNDYPITNLSHSSWDPLAYSLNRCHDISQQQHNHFAARPISWRNFS